MRIRKFTLEDARSAAAVQRKAIASIHSKDYSKKDISNWIKESTAAWFRKTKDEATRFVAVEKDKVVGVVGYADDGKIMGLFVDPACQGRNIGALLLRRIEKMQRQERYQEFICTQQPLLRHFTNGKATKRYGTQSAIVL